ncbi:hypothetical protein [Sphingomonas alpina]|uniref:Uncharacterized protein n=1 Tax=Sphingomonas alpina TaxID=653931 RepID=A0A7H0LFN1_9SPHN|nr:hypothetical protein [Sphingomonas alpina]QNQ08484.1 hypothetical protein H3Z74_17275 [Sphingomonas alpina]
MTAVPRESDAAPPVPAAYAAFLPVLEQLSVPLQRLLRGQLAQFERLIGSVDDRDRRDTGEFEGLGSLTTRGDIAHIVQSELLLRTEAPLEFLRRLAEGETLYHEKDYADPGAKPVYRLTVSVGPALLGHGRVLALAAIFFMARVAAIRGGTLHWCFVPRADGAVWFEEISVNTIKRFLRAASYREATTEDVAEAHQMWERLTAVDRTGAGARPIDWVVGVRGSRGVSARAVDTAHHSLAIALRPPIAGETRVAELTVRRKGQNGKRALIDFPSDTVCVSALNTPFAPLKPARAAAAIGPGTTGPADHGWEPRYFIAVHAGAKLVRMRDGILVLLAEKRFDFPSPFFVPLPSDIQLAGIRLKDRKLSILVQADVTGKDVLIHAEFDLSGRSDPAQARQVRRKESVAAHLFKGQHRFALPLLFPGHGVKFYSTHRREFGFEFNDHNKEAAFRVLHNRPLILCATGTHRVMRSVEGDDAYLNVLRDNGGQLADYRESDAPISPDRLRGLIYSDSHRGLAYSVTPNIWTIPLHQRGWASAVGEHGSLQFDTAPYEVPLMAKTDGDGVVATIWSDARAGGDGHVRTLHLSNGQRTSYETVLRTGADAANIVDIRITHDGIWAMTVDDAGDPQALLCYYRDKRGGKHLCRRFELDALIDKAMSIDLGEVIRG